jgi:hypothetical protein
MIFAAFAILQLAQPTDTVGMQQAFDSSLVAVYRQIDHRPLYAKAAHIYVDRRSFQRIAGIDSTAAVEWSSLINTLGTQGTRDPDAICEGGIECPWVEGTHMTRTAIAMTLDLTFHRPEKTPNGGLVAEFTPFRVRLAKRGRTWIVTKVAAIAD